MIVYFDGENVVAFNKNNKHVRIEYLWSKENFESFFGISIPIEMIGFSYEPDIGYFSVTIQTAIGLRNNILGFKLPDENPVLANIESNIISIEHEAVNQMLPDHEYDSKTDTWIISSIKLDELALKEEQSRKIENEIRQIAITSLIKKGELPLDYKVN